MPAVFVIVKPPSLPCSCHTSSLSFSSRWALLTLPVTISMTTHPRLQTSAARPWPSPFARVMTSGAMYALKVTDTVTGMGYQHSTCNRAKLQWKDTVYRRNSQHDEEGSLSPNYITGNIMTCKQVFQMKSLNGCFRSRIIFFFVFPFFGWWLLIDSI